MKSTLIILFVFLAHSVLAIKTSAIIESSDTHLYLPKVNDLTVREFVRIKILDKEGYTHVVYRDYYNAFRKIKSLHYSVFDAYGKRVKKLTKSDAVDIMINPSYEIDDTRLLILDPEYKNFPFTIEIEVEISYNGFLNFPPWMPRYMHGLEVKNASLVLECYKGFEYRSLELNGVSAPVIAEKDDLKVVRWTITNLPAVERYESFKAFFALQSKVHLTPIDFVFDKTKGNFKTWANFGDWFQELNEGRNSLGTATKQHLDDLRQKHAGNTPELVKAVYQYMQSKTRYISIQLGIGGYQTIPSDEVDGNGYGDCKALTNYMKAMLEYLCIPSNYILVYAGSDAPDIQHDFPSNQFNHLFLGVPIHPDTLWFECTSQTSPPAHTGTFTDDRHVLWIEKNNSRIIRTPAFQAHESVMKQNCTVNLSPDGDAVLKLNVTQTGMFFEEAFLFQLAKKDQIEKSNIAKFSYPDFTISEYHFDIPDAQRTALNLRYTINVNAIGKPMGSKMMVPTNFLTAIEKNFDVDVLNKYCEVRRPFSIEDHVELILPENYRIDVIPEAFQETSSYGSFEMRIEPGDKNSIHIYRKAVVQKGIYQREEFDRFYATVKKIRQIEHSKIVLQSKT